MKTKIKDEINYPFKKNKIILDYVMESGKDYLIETNWMTLEKMVEFCEEVREKLIKSLKEEKGKLV